MKLILPETIWPQQSGDYKVIQIYRDNEAFLRFSRRLEDWDDQMHYEIVQAFLGEIQVEPKLIESRNPHADYMIPILPEGTPYRITGMGKCRFDLKRKIADCFGNSIDYDQGMDLTHLRKIQTSSGFDFVV